MDRDRTLQTLSISPASRRIIEAQIAASTSGPAFWALHAILFGFISCLMIGAWVATGWTLLATLRREEIGMEAMGIPFFGAFAVLATILWGVELRFLRRVLRPVERSGL